MQLTASNHLKSLLDFRHSLTILLNLWNISRDHLRRHSLTVLPNLWNRFKWFREIAFLGITCVLPRSTVANYKQCKSSISVLNNWRHAKTTGLSACGKSHYGRQQYPVWGSEGLDASLSFWTDRLTCQCVIPTEQKCFRVCFNFERFHTKFTSEQEVMNLTFTNPSNQ